MTFFDLFGLRNEIITPLRPPETISERLPPQLQGSMKKIQCQVKMCGLAGGIYEFSEKIKGSHIPVFPSTTRQYHARSHEVLGLFYKESEALSFEFLKQRFPAIASVCTESSSLQARAVIQYANGTSMTHEFSFS